jgi:serine/threonine protein kinase/tetratricopeptide (TPR) repeat protein
MGITMSINCPKCHYENLPDSNYCKECGTQLKPVHAETRTLRTPDKDSAIGEIVSEKYKLLEELGRGGMGVVYKAEQIKPVKRSVALKIIKLGMDTRQVVARFDTERQALAVMNHPNIAKVFDGGTTETGRPYFVMELVRGIPLTEYCNKHKLTTRERLELFILVCEAIQHAHQKGVIHRDLKPSNILVVVQEEKPIPKIIDFGIAKATEHSLTEKTLFTEQGQLIGTPEYMSPEQAEMSRLDVDTRTDIYSLGVILYELLVGVLPFDFETLRKAGFGEIQRIIRETDPPRASTRLSSLGDNQTLIAQQRGADVAALHKQLKGDLDWITMKAMEKDRTRRYSTASDLAADITRHLNEKPIIARPPSNIYNIGKFVRRNKIGVTTAALVIIAIVIGGVAATIGFVKATRAERLAKQESERASREADAAEQVSNFLVDLFEVSNPEQARGTEMTALEILERGADRISEELEGQPLTQARLKATIGRVYDKMGLFNEAAHFLKEALETRQKQLGEEHIDVAQSLGALGDLYRKQGKYTEAEPLLKRSLELREKLLGPDHPIVARSLNNLAVLYENASRYAEAEPIHERAIAILEKELGTNHLDVAMSLTNLAILKAKQGKYAESEPLFQRSLSIEEKELGHDHPRVALAYNNLAIAYKLQGKYAEAEPMYKRALEIQEKVLGSKHPALSRSLNNLANLYLEQDRYQDAEPLYQRSLDISMEALGEEHPQVGLILDNLAQLNAKLGRYTEAELAYQRALGIREKALGPEHHEVGTNLLNLANLYRDQHLFEKADPLYRRSLSIYLKVLDTKHPDLQRLIEDFSTFLKLTGREMEASALKTEIGKRK